MSDHAEPPAGPGSSLLRAILKAMHFFVILGGCIMALTFFFVVILRYGFNADLFAYEEWLMVIAFWMIFVASAVATYNNVHINADILGIMLSKPKTIWIRALLVTSIELIVLFYLTYLGFLMIQQEVVEYPNWQTSIALKIPFFVPRLGIFVGFLFMTIFTVLHLIVLVSGGPKSPADDEQTCPSPLKLCHYIDRELGMRDGSEAVFGRGYIEASSGD